MELELSEAWIEALTPQLIKNEEEILKQYVIEEEKSITVRVPIHENDKKAGTFTWKFTQQEINELLRKKSRTIKQMAVVMSCSEDAIKKLLKNRAFKQLRGSAILKKRKEPIEKGLGEKEEDGREQATNQVTFDSEFRIHDDTDFESVFEHE